MTSNVANNHLSDVTAAIAAIATNKFHQSPKNVTVELLPLQTKAGRETCESIFKREICDSDVPYISGHNPPMCSLVVLIFAYSTSIYPATMLIALLIR